MWPKSLSLCALLLIAAPCYAQELGLDDGEHIPLSNAQIGVDGSYATGNFKQRRLNGRATLFKRWGEQAALLSGTRYSYMRSGELLFADDFRSLAILTHRPLATLQLYGIGLYHSSYTRFIDQRLMGGLGVALLALRSKEHQLKLGLSGAYEQTRWDSRPPPFTPPPMTPSSGCLYEGRALHTSCERQMWRLIPRFVGHHLLADEQLILDYEALWVVDPLDLSDERVYASVTLSLPLLSWLSVYAHYDISFESIVLEHREQLDAHLNFGLKVNRMQMTDGAKP